jgi:hypothetical protein
MLKNMHLPLAEGNFYDEYENAVKPANVQDYERHVGYVDKNGSMRVTPLACIHKNGRKLFLHPPDLPILN